MKMPRSIVYSTSRPCDLHVGMSSHDIVAVTLLGYGIFLESNTHSGRSAPARQWAIASIGLLTDESMCLPTSCTATVPPLLYGVSALTHSTNSSSASIDTGVRFFHENGTPVAIGVVNRFDSVMMILLGSPFAPCTSRKPSAPAPPDSLTTTIGCFIRLCLAMTPCRKRAIWSAPPPVPAGTTN